MVLDILQAPHPTLELVAADAVPGPETSLLLHSMVETLKATPNAVGLAAPQVGVSIRAFVVGTEQQGYIAVLNPQVLRKSGIKVPSEEGCLSQPGKTAVVQRPYSVTIRAMDAEGKPCTFTCKGPACFIVCHELDHLDGKLI